MFDNLPRSSPELYHQMLSQCLAAIKVNTFLDNYDAERYGSDGVDRSMLFNADYHANTFKWFFENHAKIYDAYDALGDEYSKNIYLHVIAYKMAGFHSVRIPVRFSEASKEYQDYIESEKYSSSELSIQGMFGKLKHYDFIHEGTRYVADCLGLKYYLYRGQYFYRNREVFIGPERGDYVIDGGACLGDTAIVFGNKVGSEGCVYSFDPIWDHLKVLEYNAKQNKTLNIRIMPYGISDIDIECAPLKLNSYSPGFTAFNHTLPMRSLDSLALEREIERVDFIKLDVEGSEMAALRGASGLIRKFHPRLGISVYHKPNDIFELPLYIKQNYPSYKIYMDHYTTHDGETVMYCST